MVAAAVPGGERWVEPNGWAVRPTLSKMNNTPLNRRRGRLRPVLHT